MSIILSIDYRQLNKTLQYSKLQLYSKFIYSMMSFCDLIEFFKRENSQKED